MLLEVKVHIARTHLMPWCLSDQLVPILCTGEGAHRTRPPCALVSLWLPDITHPGALQEEKVHIARTHLMPKLLEQHGLAPGQVRLEDSVVDHIATGWVEISGLHLLLTRCLTA